jgi:tRNA U34 5-methylaminomethyl-2-thiouridine-forming methyltransferase MnmC
MHPSGFTLVTVASGARSLRSLEHGETFHPVVGPMIEARGLHVGQSRLTRRAAECGGPFVIWDVGLGAAANAVAVLEAFAEAGGTEHVELHSFDRTSKPLEFAVNHAAELDYLPPWLVPVRELLANGVAQAGRVRWQFHRADFCDVVRAPKAPAPHAILYDPYSPAANPAMWTLGHFTRLRKCLDPARPCTLTSYSRSTAVRVTMFLAGFFVGRGGPTGEKDQTTVAATHREILADPLGVEWLGRVRRSTRGGPLRDGEPQGPIAPEEYSALSAMVGA